MATKTVWGIDVGHGALKALELHEADGEVVLDAFEILEHAGGALPPDADRPALLRQTVRRLLDRADLSGSHVVVSVPGRCGCTRFVHLLPVDSGSVPSLVRFEAAQQLPFRLEESIWRWQTFRDPDRPDEPDVDVGIFALRRDAVGEALLLFAEANVSVDTIQMAPLALLNSMAFEGRLAGEGATLLVDVGAGETNLVVADGRRIWTRTVELGGSRLAQAHAVDELAEAVRRAAEQYLAEQPAPGFARVVAAGGAFRLAALRPALEAKLARGVDVVDRYRRLAASTASAEPAFVQNAPALAVAYGLALQGLGLTAVHANFVPPGIAHKYGWQRAESPGALRRLIWTLLGRDGSSP
jgi:type IV pilus assembly protein PilM